MAELFLARTVGPNGFEKVVALKKILPKYTSRQKYISLFCDEARLAASLNHANIVQVYDIGIDAGNYFFAMEYLHGQDVRTILHRTWAEGEKMPIRFAVQIATQVAAALHYAHEMRRPDGSLVDIVHRDVSPSNIIVTYDGAVKLLDFGVAKAATRTVKTRTGTLKGKISYMSPEQAKGAPVDRRSDLFSLGIVLWEMVTTSRLFRGENDLATLQLIINVPPKKPTEARPDCPAELERIILKALSQDISQRYQTADEMVRDLEAFSKAADLGPSPTALSAYVSALFAAEINSWNEARAAGVPLAEHLTHIGDMTEPVLESEFIEAMDLPAMLAAEEAADSMDEEAEEGDDDDDDDDDDAPPGRFDTPAPPRHQRQPTPPVPTKGPAPKPPVIPAKRDATPVPKPVVAPAGEATETMTAPNQPISEMMTAVAGEMPTMDMTPAAHAPAAGSNPWSAVKSAGSGVGAQGSGASGASMSMSGAKPQNPIMAWASGQFPAMKIDPETQRLWEHRALLIGGIILGLIFVIAIIIAIAG